MCSVPFSPNVPIYRWKNWGRGVIPSGVYTISMKKKRPPGLELVAHVYYPST